MSSELPGKLIVFEGIDGSGKTTQIKMLEKWWNSNPTLIDHRNLVVTEEPHSQDIINWIAQNSDPITQLFLFMADRRKHVLNIIKPALAQGDVVLCDRFTWSTVVYQGYCGDVDLSLIERLNRIAQLGIEPNLTLWLYADRYISASRVWQRDKEKSFDRHHHNHVHDSYIQVFNNLVKNKPEKFAMINTNYELNTVHENIKEVLINFLDIF